MKPKIKVLTLAVADLDRSLAFYRDGLGLPSGGVIGQEFEDGLVAFFELDGGLTLALFPRASLAKDAAIVPTGEPLGAVSIGHVVGVTGGGRRGHGAGRARRRGGDRSGAGPVLGRLWRLLPRSRRASVGDRLEPGLGRTRLNGLPPPGAYCTLPLAATSNTRSTRSPRTP